LDVLEILFSGSQRNAFLGVDEFVDDVYEGVEAVYLLEKGLGICLELV